MRLSATQRLEGNSIWRILALFSLSALPEKGAAAVVESARTVPTFHRMSLYWPREDGASFCWAYGNDYQAGEKGLRRGYSEPLVPHVPLNN